MKHSSVHKTSVFAVLAIALAGALAGCSDASGGVEPLGPGTSVSKPAAVAILEGGVAQTAEAGAAVAITPSVAVKNAKGTAVAGVTVTFTVTGGGGTVANATAVTDLSGFASAGEWKLGTTAGTNTLDATVGTLAPVRFTATATARTTPPAAGTYHITYRYVAAPTERQKLAVYNAVARWQSIITRDLANIPMNAPSKACFETQPAISETVDDILIFIEFVDIDGPGNVLGAAGPCYIRSDNGLPVVGHLKLDRADLEQMERNGTIDDVVLHEIGHILGIGTLWKSKNLLTGAGTVDPRFTGSYSLGAYQTLGGADAFVPVENTGSEGTRDGHWREAVFGNELMTGYISGATNPISALTIASLTDVGYGTDPGAASTYTLNRSGSSLTQGIDMHKHERLVRPKFKVDRQGKQTKIEP